MRSARRIAGAGAPAEFALHLGQLVVHGALAGELLELLVDVVFAGAELGDVVEGARRFELLDRVGACAHVLGLVDRALHRQTDVRHLLADAGRRLGDPHLRLGGRVLRLDDLLLGAEGFDLGAQLFLGVGELLLLGFEFGDLGVERLQLGLGDVLAFERGAGELLVARESAWRACVSSLTTLCCRLLSCICRRFLAVTTSAMPFLTFCSCSTCFW